MQVLIATLGKSPIVVTSAVSLLQEERGIDLDKVCLLYTDSPAVKESFEIVKYFFQLNQKKEMKLEPIPLGISDINSEKNCLLFLQQVFTVFNANTGNRIHLLLAGGRKSMSAILGFMGFFYTNIDGMYHILDHNEDNLQKRNFYSTDKLIDYLYKPEILKRFLSPPPEELNMFDIPYRRLAPTKALWPLLTAEVETAGLLGEVPVIEEQLEFFRNIASRQEILEIKIAPQARAKFLKMDAAYQKSALDTIKLLCNGSFREKGEGKHGSFRGANKNEHFYVAKKSGAFSTRLFWYQLRDGTLVICELTNHEGPRNDYDQVAMEFKQKNKSYVMYPPEYSLNDLETGKGVIVASVGKSPLVVSQAYRSLCKGVQNIEDIYLLHTANRKIKRGVEFLHEAFRDLGVGVHSTELTDHDVDSTKRCETFMTRMSDLIKRIRLVHPEKNIYLLLSGGRKGMSVLSLFAAHYAGLTYVYHTLIASPEVERILESQDQVDCLNNHRSKEERKKYIMLEGYAEAQFHLFKLPVIRFKE